MYTHMETTKCKVVVTRPFWKPTIQLQSTRSQRLLVRIFKKFLGAKWSCGCACFSSAVTCEHLDKNCRHLLVLTTTNGFLTSHEFLIKNLCWWKFEILQIQHFRIAIFFCESRSVGGALLRFSGWTDQSKSWHALTQNPVKSAKIWFLGTGPLGQVMPMWVQTPLQKTTTPLWDAFWALKEH